jgi:SagB-type dehydrogenase family enzyme
MEGRILRRANALLARWQDGLLIIENYLTGRLSRVSPEIAVIVARVEGELQYDELRRRFIGIPDADALTHQLLAADVLLTVGSDTETRDRQMILSWAAWGDPARYFHFSTARTVFPTDLAKEGRELAELAKREPPPPPYLDRFGPTQTLPEPWHGLRGDFAKVLQARRTHRRFTGEPITSQQFATVLGCTFGRTATMWDPALGRYVLKTSPSGGARHPVEAYPIVLAVDDVPPGIYHYSVRQHGLTMIDEGWFSEESVEICANQPWVQQAAAVVVLTGVVERSAWKYRQAHAYRVLLLDVGHLGQTFQLVCTALGLGPFTSAALHSAQAIALLRIDGIGEVPLCALTVGLPVTDEGTSMTTGD